ncbi:hypothetical protein QZH41_019153, partial [Actinostola sp. cb2023]
MLSSCFKMLNECANNRSCAQIDGVRCVNYPGGFLCHCPPDKNLDAYRRCTDINECKLKTTHCRPNSNCWNTAGSYECPCNTGFKDVNGTCIDIFDSVPRNSVPIPDPYVISDIDECDTGRHRCHNNATCNNTIGGYRCACNKGYSGNGYSCEDINECKLNDTHCRNHSHCWNTAGFYECPCNKGFNDANGTCKDINECDNTHICLNSKNVECLNTIGSFRCQCRPGYVYSFKYQVCIDRNECVEKPCSAVNHSVCHNKQPYYSCDCLPGFNATKNDSVSPVARLLNCTESVPELQGFDPCANIPVFHHCLQTKIRFPNVISDINECDTGSHRCHKYATCSNTIGGYRCKCKGGYIGNGFSCKAERLFEPDPSRERNVYRTKKVNVPLGFCFGGKIYDKLYISTNGIISIGKRYRKSSPVELKDLKKDVLAPFWASSALYRFDSSVRYRELNEDDRHSASLLTKINKFVANSTRLDNFEANWAIIVTWKNLTPKFWFPWWWRFYFGRHSPFIDERNTFQAVIATNGSASVFIYLYKDDGMTWWRLGRDATVGYSTKSSDSYQVDNYFTQKIFNIDKQSFQDPAGNERKGALVLVCHPKTQRAPTPEEKCLDWIRKQSRKNNDWVGDLPQCPCTDQDMRFASVSLRFPFWGNFGGARCYVLSRKQKTKSCCYFGGSFFASGALIPRSDPRAGRALRYNPRSSYKDYQRHDAEAYDMCCVQSSLYCGDYHQLRPVDEGCEDTEPEPCQCRWRFGFRKRRRRGGRRRRGFRRGWFFGDPHITTLDGIKYSFNGLGDYIVLQTLDRTNLIHGRTKRPLSKFGGLSKATVFSGFALRSSKNTTVQVLFSDVMAGNLSITTKNTSGHCQHFGINDLQEIDGFVLSPSTTDNSTDNSTLAVLFDSGLTAEITPGLDLLQISFTIPAGDFENKTMGLLGKLNDDKNDDLMYRNGTTIPADSIDKDVFYYAQTWKVPDDEGLFVFSNCSMEPVFYDGDFKPLFLSELQQNITDRMRSVCGNNTECLLDFLLTGNEALANGTLKFEIENDKIKKVFDNLPPVITMNPKTVNARADQEFTVNVTAKDPNSDAVTLQVDPDSLPQGAAFDNITGTFTWTPPSGTKIVNIRIIARDSKGAASVVTIQIRFCDCKNGGDCLFSTIQQSYANSSLQLVSCNCSDKYTGDLCETQVDPCADKPCYKGVNCATIQQPFGYKCGDCPSGYDGNGEICSDFDECLNASRNNCTQNEKCTNIVGSFKCDCKPGYSRVANSNSCTDVNECDSLVVVSKCKDNTKCNNTLGSYNCSCERGYQGDPLKGCTDIDECSPPNQKCFGHSCTNTPGSFKCACDAGYKLRKLNDTQSCVDIDECKFPINNNCSQICKNVPASYNCACNPGLELNSDKRTCSVAPGSKCDESNGGCEKMCTNTSSVVRCHCPRGYNLTDGGKHCQDINECLKDNGGCSGKKSCINLNGTYICSCSHGYRLKADKRTCEGILPRPGALRDGTKHGCEGALRDGTKHGCEGAMRDGTKHGCEGALRDGTKHGCEGALRDGTKHGCEGALRDGTKHGCEGALRDGTKHGCEGALRDGTKHGCEGALRDGTKHGCEGALRDGTKHGCEGALRDGTKHGCEGALRDGTKHGCEGALRDGTKHGCEGALRDGTKHGCEGALRDGTKHGCEGDYNNINECLKHKGNCSQTCENIPGGKRCKCKPGYRLKTADNTTCDDVNECKEGAKCSFGRQCHNRRGGYWCRCKDRRMFSDGSFECKKSKRFRLRLRCLKLGLRDLVWSDDYEDEFSDLFKQLQDFIVKNVNKFFRSSRFRFRGSYLGCRVRGFKRGSVLTNVSVNFDENSNVTAGVVEADIKKASQIGDLTVDPTSSTFQDTDECLDPSLHHCHKDATCKNEPGSFSCHCKDGYYGDGIDCKGNDDTIMIILLCTLIPLAVIIIIIVVYCFLKRKTKGDLRVQEDIDGGRVHHVQLHETNKSSGNWAKGNEVYYGHNIGRRVSDDSATGRYDMAGPGNSFANEAKATNGGTYDVQSGSYYDNPAAASNE